jgi:hypothetical protein
LLGATFSGRKRYLSWIEYGRGQSPDRTAVL